MSIVQTINCTVTKVIPGEPLQHCEGKVSVDYSKLTQEQLDQNLGKHYDATPCSQCGVFHQVVPWIVLTRDRKNDEGAYEETCDYYIQAQHTKTNGMLNEVSTDKVERPCPDGCGNTISFSTTYSKENLQQNDGEFYELISCQKCGSGYKTIPWIAVTQENTPDEEEGKVLFPSWIL